MEMWERAVHKKDGEPENKPPLHYCARNAMRGSGRSTCSCTNVFILIFYTNCYDIYIR